MNLKWQYARIGFCSKILLQTMHQVHITHSFPAKGNDRLLYDGHDSLSNETSDDKHNPQMQIDGESSRTAIVPPHEVTTHLGSMLVKGKEGENSVYSVLKILEPTFDYKSKHCFYRLQHLRDDQYKMYGNKPAHEKSGKNIERGQTGTDDRHKVAGNADYKSSETADEHKSRLRISKHELETDCSISESFYIYMLTSGYVDLYIVTATAIHGDNHIYFVDIENKENGFMLLRLKEMNAASSDSGHTYLEGLAMHLSVQLADTQDIYTLKRVLQFNPVYSHKRTYHKLVRSPANDIFYIAHTWSGQIAPTKAADHRFYAVSPQGTMTVYLLEPLAKKYELYILHSYILQKGEIDKRWQLIPTKAM